MANFSINDIDLKEKNQNLHLVIVMPYQYKMTISSHDIDCDPERTEDLQRVALARIVDFVHGFCPQVLRNNTGTAI